MATEFTSSTSVVSCVGLSAWVTWHWVHSVTVSRGTSYNSISFSSSSDVLLPCTMRLWRDSYYCNSWLGGIYPALQTVTHFCKYILNSECSRSSSYIPSIILLLAVYNQLINLEATSFLYSCEKILSYYVYIFYTEPWYCLQLLIIWRNSVGACRACNEDNQTLSA